VLKFLKNQLENDKCLVLSFSPNKLYMSLTIIRGVYSIKSLKEFNIFQLIST